LKYLILFLSLNLWAIDYTNEMELAKGIEGKIYIQKKCPGVCYPVPRNCVIELDVCSVQEIQVDDPEKPLYANPTDSQECFLHELVEDEPLQADDCRKLMEYEDIGTEENPIVQPKLCTDKTYYPLYAETAEGSGLYTAYCTKLIGYEQKTVKRLLEDATLRAAKDAAIAAKLAAEEREAKLQQLLLKYRDKVVWENIKASEVLTPEEISDINKKIADLNKATVSK
jgi:hypothetical protein